MAVTESDVLKIAGLSRLSVTEEQLPTLVAQLNDILGHMDVLGRVDTTGVAPTAGIGTSGMPLRDDVVAPVSLACPVTALTAEPRNGFILVPRLSTHGEL